MVSVKRLILDVLKPHQPNALDFAKSIANQGNGTCVKVSVVEVDEKTESIIVIIEGADLQFDMIQKSISEMGGSLHSIDEVEVCNDHDTEVTKEE